MDDEARRMVTTSFFLGLRVSQSINNLPPPDQVRFAALMETLQAVMEGEELSLETAADLQRIRPSSTEADTLQQDYTRLQRVIAEAVLERLLSFKPR